jgi:hypothetical protein
MVLDWLSEAWAKKGKLKRVSNNRFRMLAIRRVPFAFMLT